MRGAGVILIGGRASRLGGRNKGDIIIGAASCFDRALGALGPFGESVEQIALSVAGPEPLISSPYTQIPDWPHAGTRGGPAFAILASLSWAQGQGFDFIITVPVDTPFLPADYAKTLRAGYKAQPQSLVCAGASGLHSLHALWPVAKLAELKSLVLEENTFKMSSLHKALRSKHIDLASCPVDPFLNLNAPEDIDNAKALAIKFNL